VADFKADGSADEGPRWTVRGVTEEARAAAKAAADASRQSVGEWLTALIMEAAGRPVSAGNGRQTAADPVADIERLVSSAATLAGAGNVPPGVRAPLNRAIKDQARRLGPPALPAPADKSG
jgi:hypothetical protein